LLAAAQAGVEVFEYTPSAVKMALTGYGDAVKQQVQRVVAMRFSMEGLPEPPDAADALAIALCHLQSHRMRALAGEIG
jgi:crossover junction endodeoxyribonuclease RuvC